MRRGAIEVRPRAFAIESARYYAWPTASASRFRFAVSSRSRLRRHSSPCTSERERLVLAAPAPCREWQRLHAGVALRVIVSPIRSARFETRPTGLGWCSSCMPSGKSPIGRGRARHAPERATLHEPRVTSMRRAEWQRLHAGVALRVIVSRIRSARFETRSTGFGRCFQSDARHVARPRPPRRRRPRPAPARAPHDALDRNE